MFFSQISRSDLGYPSDGAAKQSLDEHLSDIPSQSTSPDDIILYESC